MMCRGYRRNKGVAGLVLVAIAVCTVALAAAVQQRPAPNPSQTASSPPLESAPAGNTTTTSGQVQGYTLSPEQTAEAIAYARARHELYFVAVAYGFLILILLLVFRVGARFRDLAERAGRNRFLQALVFSPLLLLTIDVLSLPLAAWGHHLSFEYQQSIQSWGSWLADWGKGEGIDVLIGVLVVWILYAVIRKSPRRWWFWFWTALVPLVVLGAVAEPLIIEPLFFKFTPLAQTHPQLAMRIEQLVRRAGLEIPESRMFVMNASSKMKSVNAYVSGLGDSKRVVVWDTTLNRMTTNEILFVFGHELGHYVLGHVRDGIIFASGVLLVFLFLAYRLLRWMLARWGRAWEIRGAGDLASLPALLLLASLFGFLFTPISNAYSRHLEHQADQYGLELIHGFVPDAPQVAARAFQILGEIDLEEPNPSTAVKLWFYNHPPLDERIRFAQTYDPWAKGRAPKFVK